MQITKDQVSDHQLKLIVNLQPEDYLEKVDSEIKTLSKKVSLDGFRPGKVPPGITKKFYGNSVLLDEINKILNDSITNFIKENDLKILFQPLPYEVKHQHMDVYHPQAYEFGFEVGLRPEISLPDFSQITFPLGKVEVTDEMILKETERLQVSYGERTKPEIAGEADIIQAHWQELNENDEVKEGGVDSNSSFSLSLIKDSVVKEQLLKLKKEEVINVNIKSAFGNDEELIIHNILKTEHDIAEKMNDRFRLTVISIIHVTPAPLDQQLFDKVFGENEVKNEEEFKERLKKWIEEEFNNASQHKLENEIQKYMMKNISINLPADFVWKWINSNRKEGEPELKETELDSYLEQIKWELLSGKIVQDNKMEITKEDILEKAKVDLSNYYGGANVFASDPSALNTLADSLLKDQAYVDRLTHRVLDEKTIQWLKQQVKTETKNVTEHEFTHHH